LPKNKKRGKLYGFKKIRGTTRKVLELEKQTYLSNLSQYEGLSLREISRRSGYHFNTVKKYVDREDWNEEYRPRKERGSLLDPLKPVIDEWLEEDMKRTRKNRRTATKIFKDLSRDKNHSKLLAVGKQTVINYVSARKKELNRATYQTAMFRLHAMCEAQVDFGDVLVADKSGAEPTWHELVVSFPWSNAGFSQVCRFETKECLMEALQRVFEFIGGVPQRILFDNTVPWCISRSMASGNLPRCSCGLPCTIGSKPTSATRTARTKRATWKTKSAICAGIICYRRL